MKFKPQILLSLLLVISFHTSAQWVPLLENTRNDTMFYDPSSIVQNGNLFHVRIYSNFTKARPDDSYASKSTMTHVSINCRNKTFSVLQMIDFDEQNLRGNSRAKNFSYPKMSPIPEKSSISELEKKICD
ncbi:MULTISPECIES: surface-adhesin E family protein [unclassified Polynucleobacter]|uniref:surface-adhesin E family protein n=1 Tax=unclassified Polynucleobacter TaxID=2640945 RepID=UPI0024935FA2|nr:MULTISPECIES: surface-adhesin E family protein [unclassified Polynucleobacter]